MHGGKSFRLLVQLFVKAISYRIIENGKALILEIITTDNLLTVLFFMTHADYFDSRRHGSSQFWLHLEKNQKIEFFAKVWQSQKDFARIAVPFWAGAQASNASLGKAFADR